MENSKKFHLISFDIKGDERGSLIAIESMLDVSFEINRIYYIFNTKQDVRRGFHAHKKLKQVLICTSGSCQILLDDGKSKKSFRLDSPQQGLYIEGVIWREMHDFSEDCVLLVLASEHYDESDYIRDYDEFLRKI